jgi:hypothetical protein
VSDYYDHVKRAFIETLAVVGVPIKFNGVTKLCVTGPISRRRAADVSGYLPQAATVTDLLDDDFKAFTGIGNRSVVTIDGTDLRILDIDNEPSDPIVHLILISSK